MTQDRKDILVNVVKKLSGNLIPQDDPKYDEKIQMLAEDYVNDLVNSIEDELDKNEMNHDKRTTSI